MVLLTVEYNYDIDINSHIYYYININESLFILELQKANYQLSRHANIVYAKFKPSVSIINNNKIYFIMAMAELIFDDLVGFVIL